MARSAGSCTPGTPIFSFSSLARRYPARMEIFHRILKTAVEGGASDVHLKIGTPVIFRINRQLIAIECPFPTEEWMNNVVQQITPAHLHKRVEQEREADFSYFVPGIGRFRTNLFQQRGQWCLAMRYVKTHVPSFEELGLLEQIKKIAESPARHRAAGRFDRLRQVHHARRHDRAHQRQLQEAHRHAGRPHRIRVRGQPMRHRAARSRPGHAVLPSRAQAHPAAGPRHHHDRRNARLGQLHLGHERRRHRPPGASPRCTPPTPRNPSAAFWTSSRPTSASRFAVSLPAPCRPWFASAW